MTWNIYKKINSLVARWLLFIVKIKRGSLTNPKDLKKTGGCSWSAVTDDPQFYLSRPLPPGWYLLTIEVSAPRQSTFKLYFDFCTDEYSEKGSVHLVVGGAKRKRFFYLNQESNVRVDPVDLKFDFKINEFSIQAVSLGFAKKRILKKISNNLDEKEIIDPLELKNIDVDEMKELYSRCFRYCYNYVDDYQSFLLNKKNVLELSRTLSDEGPLISVVMPVYKPKLKYLKAAVSSVLTQSYRSIELCMVDDFSEDPVTLEYLQGLSSEDSRVKVTFNSSNLNISETTNRAIELASGKYLAFMDQDDELHIDALASVATEVVKDAKLKLIYSDEDKIDEHGFRHSPNFKPDISPIYLEGVNYINHLTVISRELVSSVGGLRKGFEGSQDHDLLLRCLTKIELEEIFHIPEILYHWRAIDGSTAKSGDAKSFANEAGLNAVSDYLKSIEAYAKVFPAPAPYSYRVSREIKDQPLVSIIIPTRDGLNILKPCIDSILTKTSYSNFEILILNNQSKEQNTYEYFDEISRDERIRVVECPWDFNFSRLNNFGVKEANGEFVLLLNNDTEVLASMWIEEMLSYASMSQVGCVGAKLIYSDGTVQHGGVVIGIGGVAGHSHLHEDGNSMGYINKLIVAREVSAVTAACLLVQKEKYLLVGGLDESLKVAFNDVDFCLKLRKQGYCNVFTPYAQLYHYESVSRGYEDSPEKLERFNSEIDIMKAKWGSELNFDPYYNENLRAFTSKVY